MWLRWIGAAIASLAVPLTFRIAFAVARRESVALGYSAVVPVVPGFAINVSRIGNEPLCILLFTLLIWLGLRILTRAPDIWSAAALGAVLGLGLLTKAYFLTAVPAVLLLLFYKYRKAWAAGLTTCAIAVAIAGWWYVRNVVTTGNSTTCSSSFWREQLWDRRVGTCTQWWPAKSCFAPWPSAVGGSGP
jgi:4-amino-4-deoxy-L-arabinose transferase-like glycosyltransferase